MRNAETILGIIRNRGTRGLPVNDLYRQLWNPNLYLMAYGRIAKNDGALTPGATPETADGTKMDDIHAIIEALRFERHRWTPARRVYIPKANGKRRPLGLPAWSDKLLQEVMRLLLEAYYEPQFSDRSHGFRPNRGCHTAFTEITRTWTGTTWFIEGDIAGCFDNIDHKVLMEILGENIQDNRFLRLVSNLLRAGYLEDWKLNATYSGTPQGGVVSPILANVYLDRLDRFVEGVLLPDYNRGMKRKRNQEYQRLESRARYFLSAGRGKEAAALRPLMRSLPANDTHDPAYRRLRYIRYADDFLLGFAGPKDEADEIKARIGMFLRDNLKLELSDAKTLVTHGRTQAARFLGYEVVVQGSDTRLDARSRRTVNGIIGLRVPQDVVRAKSAAYMRDGKPIHLGARLHDSPYSIVERVPGGVPGRRQLLPACNQPERTEPSTLGHGNVSRQDACKQAEDQRLAGVQAVQDHDSDGQRASQGLDGEGGRAGPKAAGDVLGRRFACAGQHGNPDRQTPPDSQRSDGTRAAPAGRDLRALRLNGQGTGAPHTSNERPAKERAGRTARLGGDDGTAASKDARGLCAMPCGHPCRTTAEADCTGSLSIHVAKVGSVSTVLH